MRVDCGEIDLGLSILAGATGALIVAEAVLDTDNDPEQNVSDAGSCGSDAAVGRSANHKLVKTTPKPRATKKSRGEFVGPPPPPLLLLLVFDVAEGAPLLVELTMTGDGAVRRREVFLGEGSYQVQRQSMALM